MPGSSGNPRRARPFSVLLGTKRILAAIALLCAAGQQASAQHSVALKFIGLSIHPKESPHPHLYPHRLDARGHAVIDLGAMLSYGYDIGDAGFRLEVAQAFYADCAAQPAGFSHIGFRARLFRWGRHSVAGGIGPTLIYRRDWSRLAGYVDTGYYRRGDRWQYKFLWYGGEFEYTYVLNDKGEAALTFIPGYPEVLTLAVGYRRRIG